MTEYKFKFLEPMEIRVMILYIIYQCKHIAKEDSVDKTFVFDFIAENINVNYFDMQIQFETMIEDGHIKEFVKNFKDRVYLSDEGIYVVENFASKVPLSVRDKIDSIIYDSVHKYEEQQTVKVDYWKENESCHTSVMNIIDNDTNIFKLQVSLSNAVDAQYLTSKFKEKPDFFYSKIIELCSQAIDEAKMNK